MSEGKLNLGRPNKYIDLNFEEISCDRVITDGNFANGLQNFRFSVAPSGGGCILPHMSYFMVEYNFGSTDGASNDYTATKALNQSAKVALQNNFMSCMYNACRFTIAQSEISVVNSSHAQAHTLMRRMGLTTDFIEDIGPELTGFDPDFSRRLAKTCADGVFHRDGLIDCSPYNSVPLSPESLTQIPLVFQNKEVLTRTITADGKYRYYNGSGQNTSIIPAATIYPFMSKYAEFNIVDGEGAIKTADAGNTSVRSIQWLLPAYSFLPGTAAQNAVVIDGTVILEGDDVVFYWGQDSKLNNVTFRVTETKANANQQTLILSVEDGLVDKDAMLAVMVASPVLLSGIISVKRPGSSLVQADPRSNIVNQQVIYQPPLAFFKMDQPDVFFGDMEIQMTPNSNWRQAVIESSIGGFYNVDKKHGTDYAFGIKSMRLYLARARLVAVPDNRVSFTIPDIQVANKQLPNGSSVINFNIPPSTQKIVVWIQDSAVGTHSMLPLTRFKTRQYTGGDGLNNLDRYGPWAHTFDEKLISLQLNFAGITKPITNFQRGGSGNINNATTNNMLQRWILTNQNNNNRKNPEKYHDWLSMGAYYLFDFTRSSDNLGTYLTVSVNYDGQQPTTGTSLTDTTASNVNLYVAAIYERDVALTYGEYGNVVSAATQMR